MTASEGYDAPKNVDGNQQGKIRVGKGDARARTGDMQVYTWAKGFVRHRKRSLGPTFADNW